MILNGPHKRTLYSIHIIYEHKISTVSFLLERGGGSTEKWSWISYCWWHLNFETVLLKKSGNDFLFISIFSCFRFPHPINFPEQKRLLFKGSELPYYKTFFVKSWEFSPSSGRTKKKKKSKTAPLFKLVTTRTIQTSLSIEGTGYHNYSFIRVPDIHEAQKQSFFMFCLIFLWFRNVTVQYVITNFIKKIYQSCQWHSWLFLKQK